MKRARSGELSRLAAKFGGEQTGQARTPKQRQVRLSATKQAELVERYLAGALQRELAEGYGIARYTVSEIIKRHGARRKFGLDSVEVDAAIILYQQGASLASIGRKLAVDACTVRNYLLKYGVQMRDTQGRPRKDSGPE